MTGVRNPPQPPVDIPGHLRHGTSYVYRWYRCRCRKCQDWRRGYDRARDHASRRGAPEKPKQGGDRYWYVCARNGRRFYRHDYLAGQCLRCDAKQSEEEYWDQQWKEQQ